MYFLSFLLIYWCIYFFIYLFFNLFIYSFIHLFIYLFVYLSVRVFIDLSIYLFIYFFCLFVYSFIYDWKVLKSMTADMTMLILIFVCQVAMVMVWYDDGRCCIEMVIWCDENLYGIDRSILEIPRYRNQTVQPL